MKKRKMTVTRIAKKSQEKKIRKIRKALMMATTIRITMITRRRRNRRNNNNNTDLVSAMIAVPVASTTAPTRNHPIAASAARTLVA